MGKGFLVDVAALEPTENEIYLPPGSLTVKSIVVKAHFSY
jgi:hypothetical protein